MANKKLTIVDTGTRKTAAALSPECFGSFDTVEERVADYLSRAYKVTSAVNTVEWTLGQYLSVQQVEEIISRTGHDAVDVSVKKKKREDW